MLYHLNSDSSVFDASFLYLLSIKPATNLLKTQLHHTILLHIITHCLLHSLKIKSKLVTIALQISPNPVSSFPPCSAFWTHCRHFHLHWLSVHHVETIWPWLQPSNSMSSMSRRSCFLFHVDFVPSVPFSVPFFLFYLKYSITLYSCSHFCLFVVAILLSSSLF